MNVSVGNSALKYQLFRNKPYADQAVDLMHKLSISIGREIDCGNSFTNAAHFVGYDPQTIVLLAKYLKRLKQE